MYLILPQQSQGVANTSLANHDPTSEDLRQECKHDFNRGCRLSPPGPYASPMMRMTARPLSC